MRVASQPSTPWQRSLASFLRHRSGMIGLVIVAVFFVLAFLGPFLAPTDPLAQEAARKFLPPFWLSGSEVGYWLGTDMLGRDVLSRIMHGAQISLFIGFVSVFVGAGLGVPLGLVAGYAGGLLDQIMMRIIDMMLAFPSVLLAIVIVAILEPSLTNAMIAIGIVSIPSYARVVRASVLTEREKDYVTADVALGKKHGAILFGSVLPNILGPLLVIMSLSFASAVLEAAALSFIGLGAQPPQPEWGALLLEGKENYHQAWWLVLFPGIAILFTVMGFNLLGDGLRDALDPKSISRR